MKFNTMCALVGVSSAMELPVFNTNKFAEMYDKSKKAIADVKGPGEVTAEQCDDDVGAYHFELERSHNSEIHKG